MEKLLGLFAVATIALAQVTTVGAGTTISVRTNEQIDAKKIDGKVFTGVVDQDVTDASGIVAIPKGSDAELIVRQGSNRELLLDLESVTVGGHRYTVDVDSNHVASEQRDNVGKNQRTAKYLGTGAAIGAIIGAIAGGGKGAAIGAAAGAGAGAGAQILTRGKAVKVPAEALLTFRLEQPIAVGPADSGYTRRGRHYHSESR